MFNFSAHTQMIQQKPSLNLGANPNPRRAPILTDRSNVAALGMLSLIAACGGSSDSTNNTNNSNPNNPPNPNGPNGSNDPENVEHSVTFGAPTAVASGIDGIRYAGGNTETSTFYIREGINDTVTLGKIIADKLIDGQIDRSGLGGTPVAVDYDITESSSFVFDEEGNDVKTYFSIDDAGTLQLIDGVRFGPMNDEGEGKLTLKITASYTVIGAAGAEDEIKSDTHIVIVQLGKQRTVPNDSNIIFGIKEASDGDDEFTAKDSGGGIYGGAGNDKLIGKGSSDSLEGGAGDDILEGGGGIDQLYGEVRRSFFDPPVVFEGEAGNDILRGGAGGDYLYGDFDTYHPKYELLGGDDELHGGADNDFLNGGLGNDKLYGDDDNDYLYGGAGDDALNGGAGDDVLNGDAGADTLDGGAGDDVLNGGAGDDSLTGGAGADKFWFSQLGTSTDTNNDTITDFDRMQGDKVMLKTGTIAASAADAWASSKLTLSNGRITADGWDYDSITGTSLKPLNKNTDVWFYQKQTETERDATHTMWGGADQDYLEGNNNKDIFYGGAGDDYLYGDNADDFFSGDGGNDVFEGGHGNDQFWFGKDGTSSDTNHDTIRDFNRGNQPAGSSAEKDMIIIKTGEVITTSDETAWTLVSNLTIVEVGDDDTKITMNDWGANDSLTVNGRQTLTDWSKDIWFHQKQTETETGTHTMWGGAGQDYLEGNAGNDALNGGDGADYLEGNAGDDILNGGGGADYLDGGAGDDILNGGGGDDIFVVEYDASSAHADNGADTIKDFTAGDKIRIEKIGTGYHISLANLIVTDNTGGGVVVTGYGNGSSLTVEGGWTGLSFQKNPDFFELV